MLALELRAGLAAVVPSALWLFVFQAGAELDIDTGRGREPEALRYLNQIELVHVEDGPERVGGISLKVRAVTFLSGLFADALV